MASLVSRKPCLIRSGEPYPICLEGSHSATFATFHYWQSQVSRYSSRGHEFQTQGHCDGPPSSLSGLSEGSPMTLHRTVRCTEFASSVNGWDQEPCLSCLWRYLESKIVRSQWMSVVEEQRLVSRMWWRQGINVMCMYEFYTSDV